MYVYLYIYIYIYNIMYSLNLWKNGPRPMEIQKALSPRTAPTKRCPDAVSSEPSAWH